MHEAGLAAAVADAIRTRDLDPASIRLVVKGGHGDVDSFDTAFRLHLALALPGADVAAIPIEHQATRLCVACGAATDGPGGDGPCGACGGAAIAVPSPERVAIEPA